MRPTSRATLSFLSNLRQAATKAVLLTPGFPCPGALAAQMTFAPLASHTTRAEHLFVYDAARAATVRFGGSQGTSFFNDTWEFNGTTWRQIAPASSPSARGRPAAAYDPVRQVVVLFGGITTGNAMLSDTWTWNGTNWTRLNTTNAPSPRSSAAMVYYPPTGRMLLFGGWVPSGLDNNETWEFDGTDWRQLTGVGTPPRARGAHRMVYDPTRSTVVMFGGWDTPAGGTLGDTWEFNGTWSNVAAPNPSSRCDPSMQFDPVRGRIVLFGGLRSFNGSTPVVINDIYDYGGPSVGWTARAGTNRPGARAYAEMVWDAPRSRMVMHGGVDASGSRGETYAVTRTNAATAVTYGTACATSTGLPTLTAPATALPWLGGQFAVQIGGAVPMSGQSLLWVGNSRTTWAGATLPLPLDFVGLTGCQLHAAFDVSLPLALTGGQALVSATLCGNCPSFVGRQLFLQALVIDPAVARPLPGAVTAGLELTIGAN